MTDPRHLRGQSPPPVDLRDTFDAQFQAVQSLISAGQTDQAQALIAQLRDELDRVGPVLAAARSARLDALQTPAAHTHARRPEGIALPPGLDPDQTTLPGVSLVTATRNRTDNLVLALRSWLALDQIREVVIIDWSSDIPVSNRLAAEGLTDPRIRVTRVEGEPAWVLTWAFNLGFRLAQHAQILKADADVLLNPKFFETNPLAPGQMITGNWRNAPAGQQYLNGLAYIHRADLAAVQGFNEFITRYGWDDDDLYERLTRAGCARIDLAAGSATHIDHDDTVRLAAIDDAIATGWTDLRALPMFGIRTNRLIAALMPDWTPARRMQPFAQSPDGTLHRAGPLPHPVPGPMLRTAELLAGRELLSWQAGPRTFELEDDDIDLLLSARRLAGTTALHVALMLARAPLDLVVAPRHLVVDLNLAAVQARPEALFGLKQSLMHAANTARRSLVLRGPEAPGDGFGGVFADLICLPAQTALGHAPEVDLHSAAEDTTSPVVRLTAGLHLLRQPPPHPAPALERTGSGRLFIDAQHGLGNRLRAIGSAAAIARATGRELVIVWEPDAHCEARLSDLFDYRGAAQEHSFQPPNTTTLLSYMELEAGAAKDAALTLTDGQDAYVRSAYVLNHPASHFAADAAFLRALQPSAAVMDLIREHTVDHPRPAFGIHIRMQGDAGAQTRPYDSDANWTAASHSTIQHWRRQSHYDRFITRLSELFHAQPAARAFLAADTPASYAAFEAAFGDRVSRLERAVYDRSAVQLQYALADALLLAQTRHFLGSQWSSFSELVTRLSTSIESSEKAGVDF